MSQRDYQGNGVKLKETKENDASRCIERRLIIKRNDSENNAKKLSPIRKLNQTKQNENNSVLNENIKQYESKNVKTKCYSKNKDNSRNIISKFILNENNSILANQQNERLRSFSNLSMNNNSKINESILNCSKITKASDNALEKMDNKPIFKLMDIITKGASDWSFQVPKIVYNEEVESSQNTINSILE